MLWFLSVTITILIVQSFLYTRFAFSRLTYHREFDRKTAYVGDEIRLVETITNRKILPLPWITLESSIHSSLQFHTTHNLQVNGGDLYQNHRSFFSLLPYMEIRRKHRITCTKRGCYRMNSASISTGDAVGFRQVTRRVKLQAQILVYPEIVEPEDLPTPSRWLGDLSVERWIVEDPFMISGAREYRDGDPQHQIHWKATARTGKLYVHNRDYTADQSLMVFVNFDISEDMWKTVIEPERIERALSYAASYATHLIRSGGAVGFGCNGMDIDDRNEAVYTAAGRGKGHLLQLYETIARLVIERSVRFDTFLRQEVMRQPRQTDYILLTSFVSDTMKEHIEALRQLGNRVKVIRLTADRKEVLRDDGTQPQRISP